MKTASGYAKMIPFFYVKLLHVEEKILSHTFLLKIWSSEKRESSGYTKGRGAYSIGHEKKEIISFSSRILKW